ELLVLVLVAADEGGEVLVGGQVAGQPPGCLGIRHEVSTHEQCAGEHRSVLAQRKRSKPGNASCTPPCYRRSARWTLAGPRPAAGTTATHVAYPPSGVNPLSGDCLFGKTGTRARVSATSLAPGGRGSS